MNNKEEIEILSKEIQGKCGKELEAQAHSLQKPMLIILNVPEDVLTSNMEDAILRTQHKGGKYYSQVHL
jgi:hypothetical protein